MNGDWTFFKNGKIDLVGKRADDQIETFDIRN